MAPIFASRKRTYRSRPYSLKRSKLGRRRATAKWVPQLRLRMPPTVRSNVNLGRGFPQKITETHTYCETVTLNTGAGGTLTSYSFSANGMFDPNITGTGHQPMFYDQMAALYNHYCVIGSKCTVEFVTTTTTSTSSNSDATVGIILNDSTSIPTLPGLLEHPTSKHRLLGSANAMGASPVRFVQKFSAKKNFGKFDQGNSNFTGSISTNPGEQMYYTLFVDGTQATNAIVVRAMVTILYIAIWAERTTIAAS